MESQVKEAQTLADRNELLIWAAARGLLADAAELLSQGAEANTRDKAGLTPCHYAASKGHLDVLQFLATKGVDLEAEDLKGRTPLHYAAAAGTLEASRWLIGRSAWLDTYDAADDTPLHLAARNGHTSVCKLLLDRGADSALRNKRGLTPLGEAVAGGWVEVAEQLQARGSDVSQRSGGFSLLHVAAGMGQPATLKWLLSLGRSASKGTARLDVDDAGNEDAATPLHAAALAGSVQCAELLLQHGADASLRSAEGQLPADLATAATLEATAHLRKVLTPAAAQGSSRSKPTAPAAPAATQQLAASQGTTASSAQDAAKAAAKAAKGPGAGQDNAAGAGQGGQWGYAAQFARLNPQEQLRRVDALARMDERDIKASEFLSAAACEAVLQVRRAHQILGAFQAVTALRSDADFQEDASDPRVRAALEEAQRGEAAALERHAADRQVLSVMGKLKKLHGVLQHSGGLRISLPDLLVPPGGAAAAAEESAKRLADMTAALERSRELAVDAILGRQSAADAQQEGDDRSRTAAADCRGVASSSEIAAAPEDEAGAAAGAAGREAGEKSEYDSWMEEQMAIPWKERMWAAFKQSSQQALTILAMMAFVYAVLWSLGRLPQQQAAEVWQAKVQQAAAAAAQRAQGAAALAGGGQAAAQAGQPAGWDAGHGQEL